MITTSKRMKVVAAAAAIVIGVSLAGCSSGENSGTGSQTTSAEQSANFNDADVAFLQQMYPHHAQAVDMAELAEGRSQNPEVLDLATKIKNAQAPEMEQMTKLLASFGKPAPTTAMQGMDHGMDGGMGMGMMTQEQMNMLKEASGADFDRMFLEMMVDHHEGAIEMAETELKDGRNSEVKEMAQAIVDAQTAEIEQIKKMLDAM